MSVYKKLQEVQKATRSLAPNTTGQTGAATYQYVSGAKLLGIIRPIMDKVGLILTQEIIGCTNTPVTYATSRGTKTEMFTSLHIRFTWIDSEDESKIENEFFANGMNAWDKGLGSALTYAERYYLMKFFHIATDEDDADAIVREEAVQVANPAPAPTPEPIAAEEEKKFPDRRTYLAMVKKQAIGTPAKSGKTYRETFIEMYSPDADQLLIFDTDVADYKSTLTATK